MHVDKRPVATVTSCTYTHEFPAEGRYEVTLHVVGNGPSFKVDDVVTVQPNAQGHTRNGQAIFAALMGDLYPLGLGAAPRAPDEASVGAQ